MKRTEEEPYGGGEPYPLGTYTDHTGTDLMQFLVDTLQNNPKDRLHLLKIEKQLTDLIKDPKRTQHKFGPMSSYHRMLVHRVAAFFGMNHNVISVDNSVIVSKTRTTRLPKFKFSQQIKSTYEPEPPSEPVRSIIKRDSSSSEKGYLKDKSPDDRPGNHIQPLADTRRSKSLEEREEEYEKARARIFNQDSTSSTENPSDACANTSITDDSVATTSSGVVLSANSSLNCSHESNEGSSSRSRFLRLQRQKRLPDSFDSADSARTSFISTSSSMSSTSGMFLSPDSCLTAQKSSSLPTIDPVSTTPIPLCYIHPAASLPAPQPHQPSMNHQHHHHQQHHNKLATRVNSGQNTRIYSSQCHSADQRFMTNATTANPHNQQMGRPPENYPSNGTPDSDMLGQSSSQHKSNLILLGSQLPVNTSSYGSYQPIPLQRSPLRAVPQVQSLVPSFQNQPQTNRIPNVPFNHHPIAVSSVPASAPSSSRSGTLVGHQPPLVTGNGPRVQLLPPPPSSQSSIGCNNGLINHANFPYAINHHVSLPPAHTNGGQLATATNFSYVPSMQVPPTIPMYVNTNGGNNFAPNQLTGAHHPMPPPHHQAQIIQSPYSPQNPVYRPVQLFFVFNFQNKRNN